MSFYIQPPIFNQVQPVPIVPVTNVATQVAFLYHYVKTHFRTIQNPAQPKIQMKILFYGHARPGFAPGFWCAETSVIFDSPPMRQIILATLSNWAAQINVPTPIYAGQAKMYIAESPEAGITIDPNLGVLPPTNLYKTIELLANPPPPIFQRDMENIKTARRAAFLVVNMDTHAEYAQNAQNAQTGRQDSHDNRSGTHQRPLEVLSTDNMWSGTSVESGTISPAVSGVIESLDDTSSAVQVMVTRSPEISHVVHVEPQPGVSSLVDGSSAGPETRLSRSPSIDSCTTLTPSEPDEHVVSEDGQEGYIRIFFNASGILRQSDGTEGRNYNH